MSQDTNKQVDIDELEFADDLHSKSPPEKAEPNLSHEESDSIASSSSLESNRKKKEKSPPSSNEPSQKVAVNHQEILIKYMSVLGLIILASPFLSELYYEKSKGHIEWVQQYKTPQLDALMHLFSDLGEGNPYFYAFVILWATNKNTKLGNACYEGNYFIFALVSATQMSYILKPCFHMSRPYFDNINLGDTIMKDCSAEFGNPSGHSLLAGQTPLTVLWYYEQVHAKFFKKHRFLKVLARLITGLFIIGVVYSRVYTGRHSFDQVLTGLALGYWCAHIAHHYWRPHVFDVSLDPNQPKENHFRQVKWVLAIFLVMVAIANSLFWYIELFFEIPPQWFEHAKVMCPHLKECDMFHYNSVAGVGFGGYIVAFYLHKAYYYNYKKDATEMKLSWKEGDTETYATFLEFIIRIAFVGLIDHIFTNMLPIYLFGTKNLHMQWDFLIKKVSFTLALAFYSNSQTVETSIMSIFRPNILKQRV